MQTRRDVSQREYPVRRAPDCRRATVQDVRVDHGRADVAVPQELLDGPDGALGHPGLPDGALDGPLQDRLVQVVAAKLAGDPVTIDAGGGKDPLSGPLPSRVRV